MYNPEITTTIKMVNISIIIFVAHLLSLSLLLPWRRFGLLSVTRDCFAFLEFCISRIISYVLFFVYLLSISVILLRFIHVVACIKVCPFFSFLFLLKCKQVYWERTTFHRQNVVLHRRWEQIYSLILQRSTHFTVSREFSGGPMG